MRPQPGVRHLEEAAHVVRRVAIEESARVEGVAIAASGPVAVAFEKPQRDQRIEEIRAGAVVKASACWSSAPVIARLCSVVNSPSSMAESRVLAGQKAMPTSMMRAGVTGSIDLLG